MCGGGDNEVKQTEGEKQIAAIAAEKWNHWVQNLSPMMDEFIDRSQMRDTDYERAAGAATIDTQAAYGSAREVNPGEQKSGNLAVSLADTGLKKANTLSSNQVSSQMLTDDRHLAGLKAIVAAGQGVDSEAQASMSDVASLNLNRAMHDARLAQAKDDMYAEGVGTAIGMGAHAMMPQQGAMQLTARDQLLAKGGAPQSLNIGGMQYDTGFSLR